MWGNLLSRLRSSGNKRDVSLWATGHGLTYTHGTSRLFDYLHGEPYSNGYGTGIAGVATGQFGGERVLIMVFRTRMASGETGAPAVTVAVELPAAVPELSVRRETDTDRVRGRDLQLESEEFNAAFRISCAEPKFAYDVLSPTMMQFLLGDPRSHDYRIRYDGRMLTIWRDGSVQDVADLERMFSFAQDMIGHTAPFVFDSGWNGQTQVAISDIPVEAFGTAGVGVVHERRTVSHRGREVEQADHIMDSRGIRDWFTVVGIDYPNPWPTIMVTPKKFLMNLTRYKAMTPKYDDEVLTGNPEFDEAFAVGSPKPEWAHSVLTPQMCEWLLSDERFRECELIFVTIILRPGRDNVSEVTRKGRVEISAPGLLTDTDMVARITDQLSDVVDRLDPACLAPRTD